MAKTEALSPTPERERHDVIVEVPTDKAGVVAHQVAAPHVLDRYHARGELAPGDERENARRYEAGCMLRSAWEDSGLEPVVVGGYETAVDGFRDPEVRLVRGVDGARRWRRLIRLVGVECSWPVVTVCAVGEPCGRWNIERLRRGLARLADELQLA